MDHSLDKIYVEETILHHPYTKKILSKLDSGPIVYIDDYKKIGLEKSFNQKDMIFKLVMHTSWEITKNLYPE